MLPSLRATWTEQHQSHPPVDDLSIEANIFPSSRAQITSFSVLFASHRTPHKLRPQLDAYISADFLIPTLHYLIPRTRSFNLPFRVQNDTNFLPGPNRLERHPFLQHSSSAYCLILPCFESGSWRYHTQISMLFRLPSCAVHGNLVLGPLFVCLSVSLSGCI